MLGCKKSTEVFAIIKNSERTLIVLCDRCKNVDIDKHSHETLNYIEKTDYYVTPCTTLCSIAIVSRAADSSIDITSYLLALAIHLLLTVSNNCRHMAVSLLELIQNVI